jgi:hypothetical protein
VTAEEEQQRLLSELQNLRGTMSHLSSTEGRAFAVRIEWRERRLEQLGQSIPASPVLMG